MGIGFVLLLWAIFGSLVTGASCALICLFLRPKWKRALQLIAIATSLGFVVTPVLFVMQANYLDARRSSDPRELFHSYFGFEPTADVSDLEGDTSGIADYRTTIIRFKASQTTIQRIISQGFEEEEKRKLDTANDPVGPAFLGERLNRSTAHYYVANHFGDTYGSTSAYLLYDTETRDAYFHWVGVD